MGNATDGRKIIFYKDVVGIQFKQLGSLLGFIQLETAAHIKNENSANFYSENSFVFQTITDEIWAAYQQYIVERVESMKNSESVAPLSPMDELKKLKEVFDLGIITEDEFSQKKKKLLDLQKSNSMRGAGYCLLPFAADFTTASLKTVTEN